MLHAHKANLQTNLRQRLLAIRERELDYYTDINRNIGNQAALIAGFAYSGIRYHYLVERQHSWQLSDGDSLEEVVFTSLLTMAMGCGLQTVLIAMLVAMLGPSLALRGGDGALHDAVKGMQAWTSAVLVLFLLSLFLLQARTTSALFTLRARARNPPTRLTSPARAARSCRRSRSPSAIRRWAPSRAAPSPPPSPSRSSRRFGRPSSRSQSSGCRRRHAAAQFGAIRRNSALHGAFVVRTSLRRLRARASQAAITGEFHSTDHGGLTGGSHFEDTDGLSRRAVGCDATRIAGDDGRLLTAESLDAAMAAALRDERRGGGYDGRLRWAGGEEDEDDEDEGAALYGRRRGGGARNGGGGGAGSALLGGRSGARNGGGRPRTPSGSDVAARVLKRLVLGSTERNTCFGGGDARGAYRTVEMTGG